MEHENDGNSKFGEKSPGIQGLKITGEADVENFRGG